MGNRAYITLKDKEKTQSYYVHWNGGPDTWYSIGNFIKQNKVNKIEYVQKFYNLIADRDMEKQDYISFDLCEENGHYLFDLNKGQFLHRQCIYNELTGYDDYIVKNLVDFESDFKSYNWLNITQDYQDKNYKEYWLGIQELLKKEYPKMLPVKTPQDLELEAFIKESPYRLTQKEKTILKRKLKELSKGLGLDIKASMRGDTVRVNVTLNKEIHCDIDETKRVMEQYYSVDKKNTKLQAQSEVWTLIEKAIDSIILPHQECYAERDLYTDYYGSYRIDYFYKDYDFTSEVKEKVLKELLKEGES